jgi:hypothetical protein
MTVICVHAPIEGNEDENYFFYKLLQKILEKIKSDMIAIMEDFNARAGNIKIHNNIGPNGENTCNRNGKRLRLCYI